MSPKPTDRSESPLEEILESIPQKEPPEGLRDRCLATIRELASKHRAYSRRSLWRPVLQAAAIGGVISCLAAVLLVPTYVHRATQRSQALSRVKQLRVAQHVYAPAEPALSSPSAEIAAPYDKFGPSAPAQPAPAAGPAAPTAREEDRVHVLAREPSPRGDQTEVATLPASALPEALDAPATESPPGMPLPPAEARYGTTFRAGQPMHERLWDEAGAALVRPWRDESAERQKKVHQQLEVGVPDVEEAFDRAVDIVERAEGWTENEELRLGEDEEHYAYFTARVPIGKLREVVSQLRALGEVIIYRTESDDVTGEYHGRGAEIRTLGAEEEKLVKQYLEETDRHKKRALYQQIMSLRERNRQKKEAHQALSHQTHFAYLDVTLREKTTPLAFLGEAFSSVGHTLAWVAATAIIWLPLLVLVVVLWQMSRLGQVARPEEE